MDKYKELACNLRSSLHMIPEKSMQEIRTKKMLMDFLRENTGLEIHDMGLWFYAKWTAAEDEESTCFRADYDAVTDGNGISRHLCGHDGHAAALAAFAVWIWDNKPDKNVCLLFQPGEESGEGAKLSREIFSMESISEIFGFHNIPGYSQGMLLLREGTFACASTGLCIRFTGSTTHAAYPENGKNPADAVAKLLLAAGDYVKETHEGMILSTVIGIDLGSSSYGVSAHEGVLRLTVRAEYYTEFDMLISFIHKTAAELAEEYGLTYSIEEIERFPSTENSYESVKKLETLADNNSIPFTYLKEPFRWSEDYGWYLQEKKGAIFGVGAGEDWPDLHTENCQYNDEVTDNVLKIYRLIVSGN